MTVNFCKDCPDRHIACHDSCQKYAKFKAENAERKRYLSGFKSYRVFHYDWRTRKKEKER